MLSRLTRCSSRVLTGGGAPPRLAVWLAAWLAGQLGWKSQGEPERAAGHLRASFQSNAGPVSVVIETIVDPGAEVPRLLETTLTTRTPDGAETCRLVRASATSAEVHIEVDSPDYCKLPRMVLAPELDSAHRVAAALESSRNDPPFQHALPHALWLLGINTST